MNAHTTRRISRVTAAAAVTAFALWGLGAVPAFAAPPPVEAATISVLDANGNPVSGALVTITPASDGGIGPEYYGTTMADGTLSLSSVAGFDASANPYGVWVNANGYAGYWDGTDDFGSTVPITIVDAGPAITATVPANNPPDATSAGISGRVTDALTGAPIPGVLVNAVDMGNQGDNSGASQSGADGTYFMNFSGGDLPSAAGVQFVTPMTGPSAPYGYAAQFFDNISDYSGLPETPVPVTAGATAPNIDAALMPNGLLSGTVSVDGAPLANAQINAWSIESNTVVSSGTTDASGMYRMPTPPGVYKIEFDRLDAHGNVIATLWFSDAASREAGADVAIQTKVETGDIDGNFVTTPPPPPAPTSTAAPETALAESGGSPAGAISALALGMLIVAAGAVVIVAGRRRGRRAH